MQSKLENSSVLFVGVARNCETTLQKTIEIVEGSFERFHHKEWIIVESDSSDLTKLVLEKLSSQHNLNNIYMGNLSVDIPVRTERLAVCRNRYLHEIFNNYRYLKHDYVVVVDMDGVNNGLTKSAVESCWELEINWDACFANQLAPYYDLWALRHKYWMPNDYFEEIEFYQYLGRDTKSAQDSSIYSRMFTIDQHKPPIKVLSAFGGLGIYKKDVLREREYRGIGIYGRQVCEHVSLHEQMSSDGCELYVVPTLINGGWNEHNAQSQQLRNLLLRITQKFAKFRSIL